MFHCVLEFHDCAFCAFSYASCDACALVICGREEACEAGVLREAGECVTGDGVERGGRSEEWRLSAECEVCSQEQLALPATAEEQPPSSQAGYLLDLGRRRKKEIKTSDILLNTIPRFNIKVSRYLSKLYKP